MSLGCTLGPYPSEDITRGRVERSLQQIIGAVRPTTVFDGVLAVQVVPFHATTIVRHTKARVRSIISGNGNYQRCSGLLLE